MKEPPIVAVYRDCMGIETSCDTCKHYVDTWAKPICDLCTGSFCGYEPKEGWDSDKADR